MTVAISAALCQSSAFGQSIFGPTTYADQLPPEKLADIEMHLIKSLPAPPSGAARPLAPQGAAKADTGKTLAVPTSTATYGATATAAGMIFAYYDRNGYSNMYTGPCNGGVCPLTDVGQGSTPASPIAGSCSIIATQNGFDGRVTPGHVDDYWVALGATGPDPWAGVRPEHAWGGCVADFMGPNQWKWATTGTGVKNNCSDGVTAIFYSGTATRLYDYVFSASYGLPQTEGCHGMRLFAESRGYTVLENYTQRLDTVYTGGFSFANYVAEIDAGYPVMFLLGSHTVVGVGYDTVGSTVYLNDGWDNSVHTMTWGGTYAGFSPQAAAVFHLVGVVPGSVHVTLEPAAAVTAGAQWKLDAGAWQDSGTTLAAVPGGVHTVSFKDVADRLTPDSRQFNLNGGIVEFTETYYQLCEGVDDCNRAWTTSGDADWKVQTAVTHDGTDAAMSRNHNDLTSSTLSTEVEGPTIVGFWWKVDSEATWDFLRFYVDGVEIEAISGVVDWTYKTHTLDGGMHALTWTYTKDMADSAGADAGWVDQFSFDLMPPTGTIVINNNRTATKSVNSTLALTWEDGPTGSGVARMRFSDDGATWTAWESLKAPRAYALRTGDGYKTVRVQYLDKANNKSLVYNDYIRLDTVTPTGGILINNDAAMTTTRAVTLKLNWADVGAGVTRMRFSDNGSTWTAWESQKATRAYTIPAGLGNHTVRVQYTDAAENYSLVYNDYIKLIAP
jgi:hypothetical protein